MAKRQFIRGSLNVKISSSTRGSYTLAYNNVLNS